MFSAVVQPRRPADECGHRGCSHKYAMPTLLTETIDRLAGFEPVPFPVLSLYLNTQPDSVGRDQFSVFLRKALAAPLSTYRASSPERESLMRDVERIEGFVAASLEPSANGAAVFACSGADGFFEAVQLDAPIDQHALYVGSRPHLYPLARLDDRYPRYAAVVADTTVARILVFGMNRLERAEEVAGQKTRRVKSGGWSQARFQRHVDHYHLHHVKDVVERLDQIVRDERIPHVVLAGDEVVVPLFREQIPQQLAAKVIDVVRLDARAPEHAVLRATLETLHREDAKTDAAVVERLFDEVRAGGLGVAGAQATLEALTLGQVDVLLLTANPAQIADAERMAGQADAHSAGEMPEAVHHDGGQDPPAGERAANRLVTLARQTSASVRFIEDGSLLADIGGVGALLRFRL